MCHVTINYHSCKLEDTAFALCRHGQVHERFLPRPIFIPMSSLVWLEPPSYPHSSHDLKCRNYTAFSAQKLATFLHSKWSAWTQDVWRSETVPRIPPKEELMEKLFMLHRLYFFCRVHFAAHSDEPQTKAFAKFQGLRPIPFLWKIWIFFLVFQINNYLMNGKLGEIILFVCSFTISDDWEEDRWVCYSSANSIDPSLLLRFLFLSLLNKILVCFLSSPHLKTIGP